MLKRCASLRCISTTALLAQYVLEGAAVPSRYQLHLEPQDSAELQQRGHTHVALHRALHPRQRDAREPGALGNLLLGEFGLKPGLLKGVSYV
jgi:hypothetical protein